MFAHPFWLYHPIEVSGRIGMEVSIGDNVIEIGDDAELPPGWRAMVRAAGLLPAAGHNAAGHNAVSPACD